MKLFEFLEAIQKEYPENEIIMISFTTDGRKGSKETQTEVNFQIDGSPFFWKAEYFEHRNEIHTFGPKGVLHKIINLPKFD
jgi:hypothetical protein